MEGLPAITIEKVGSEQLATTDGRAFAIGQLINKHSGEIVELDQRCVSWTLERLAPGSASAPPSE